MKKMKAVLFARVSTREQAEEGYSLSAQIRLLKDYAQKNNFVIAKQFIVPESASGKQERKIFNQLLEYLTGNPTVKIQLWEKVDRSARNFKDSVKLDDWLSEDEERQIHFVKQSLIMHANSKSHEKFMWDIYVATARQYSNNLSEETRKGLYEKASQGHYPGNHKRGYKSSGDIGHKVWIVDNEKPDAKYIEMAFVLYDTGNYTLRTLAKELFEQGWKLNGKQVSISELHKLLIDPFYCGEFIWKDKLYKNAKHPPLVTKELFYSVQDRLQRKIKAGKYRKHSFLLGGGLLLCDECGYSVTAELQKGHNYYHCTKRNMDCSQRKYVREETLLQQVLETFDKFKVDNSRLLEWIRKALKESHQDEDKYHESTMNELHAEYLKVKNRLGKLYDDKVDGLISKETYLQKQAEYEQQLNDLIDAKQKHSNANINYLKLGFNIFELAQVGREVYEKQSTDNEKRELLNFVFSNFKLNGEKLVPTPQNGFDVVFARAQKGNWLLGLDSNQDERIQSPLSHRLRRDRAIGAGYR